MVSIGYGRRRLPVLVCILLALPAAAVRAGQLVCVDLGGQWQLSEAGSKQQIAATVPGCVHTDLMAAGKIPDPFYRDYQAGVQWIGETGWVYSRSFTVSQEQLSHAHILLRCEGLDTVAAISINGKPLAQTDNMFRTYEFDIKPLLVPGGNTITVAFSPISEYIKTFISEAHGPASSVRGMANVRKAPYSNGWDFAPKFLTCGIYKKIEILAFNQGRLTQIATHANLEPLGKVSLDIDAFAENDSGQPLHAIVSLKYEGKQVADGTGAIAGSGGHLQVDIPNPQLWWPNGMGSQPLYDLTVQLQNSADEVIDTRSMRVGLRKIELLPKTTDRPLRLLVNGREMFAKGADWVPLDMLPSRVTPAKIRHYIEDATAVHMNMLRCWGGGYYEEDAFYDACDEKGILVWSEFKFACAIYPNGNPAFVANVRAEVTDQVDRLRNHPCIAVWCGNNEVTALITGYKLLSRKDYDALFHGVVGAQVKALIPDANYVGGSPEEGDEHNWWVWHVGANFEKYLDSHGWMTEFGFQSFPCPATVDSFTEPTDRTSVLSLVMKAHQHNGNGRGNEMILDMMGRYFKPPRDFDSTLWLSQINQAYGVTMGIEHWRSDWPRSSGALVWQYDDSWPGVTWASVDYFGRWKALQYKLREAFTPLMVTAQYTAASGEVAIAVCGDQTASSDCMVQWTLTNLDGKQVDAGQVPILIPAGTSSVPGPTLQLRDSIKAIGPRNLILWITLSAAENVVSRKMLLFVRPKELDLKAPEIVSSVVASANGFDVKLTASHPALWTWIELTGDPDARYSDNFVHLRPGMPIELQVTPSHAMTLEQATRQLRVRSLFDTY